MEVDRLIAVIKANPRTSALAEGSAYGYKQCLNIRKYDVPGNGVGEYRLERLAVPAVHESMIAQNAIKSSPYRYKA